ncbi:SLAP domain-containing protein [Lactobacillus sp. ESL0791]|uniref:SLAP domain-containing protein n=1 Tax=Lactobacillus sp. ESL0791 TaxID=2983234 RepID=UPI0023F9F215|nr:SLAP domain-containing protein [Lactobacillus sp. ESL0791]MDF7639724.1 SLAP domain-containing protein [Lactobacillus sp. ESL0791]
MYHNKYRKILVAAIAVSSVLGNLALANGETGARTVSAKTTLKVPALSKKAKIRKKAKIYNKKGHRVGKKFLKKGKKLTVYGIKKIHGKKYYSIGHGRYILASSITILPPKEKPATTDPVPEPSTSIVNNSSSEDKVTDSNTTDTTNTTPQSTTNMGEKNPATGTTTVSDIPAMSNTATVPDNSSKPEGTTVKDFSISEFRQEFLKALNEERAKQNLKPVTEDTHYDDVVENRSALLPSNFSHTDASGNFILQDYFDKAGLTYTHIAECIANYPWGWYTNHDTKQLQRIPNGGTSADVADNTIYEYIYNDAASDWGHRKILLDPSDKTIGVGAATTADGRVYSAVGVTY